jgi:hypothetical protein
MPINRGELVCENRISIFHQDVPLFWDDPKKLYEKTNMDMIIGM